MKNSRSIVALLVCGISLAAMAAQACGVDVQAFASAHAEALASLAMLGTLGEVSSIEQIKPELVKFAEEANKKIGAADGRVKSVEENLARVQLEINELAGKAANVLGSISTNQQPSVGAQVAADEGLEGLRSTKVKSLRVAIQGFGLGQKAALTSADLSVPAQRDIEVYGPLARRTSVRDLLVTRPTSAPSIEYLRGTRTGAAGIQAVEGDQKAEMALDFELKVAQVRTIAAWIPASRQALDDAPMLKDYIDLELRDALQLKEDEQLLKGPGTGTTISGLWTNAIAYSRGVTGDNPNDTLRRAITQVQLARGVATGMVINPIGLELLELEKDLEGRYLVSYVVTDENGRTNTWRVPVVVTDALEANEFLVGDFQRAARLYDRQQAGVEIFTQHADFATRNLVAILAEERVALTVNRPEMLVKGTFA